MDRVVFCFYRGLLKCLSRLGFGILYGFSDLLWVILYGIVGYRKNIVRSNLAASFPQKSKKELRAIEKEFYRQLCDNFVEIIKMLTADREMMRKRIVVKNQELVERIAAEGKPVVLLAAHMGNWEWVPSTQWFYKHPKLSGEIYKPLRDIRTDRILSEIRRRFGSFLIPQKKAYRELVRLRKTEKTFLVGFVADHRPNAMEAKHKTTFLNHKTFFDVGGERIGNRIGAGFLYLDVSKIGRGRYVFEFVPVIADVEKDPDYPVMRAYYRLLEENIRRQPALWLWSHRRWLC